ncbi:MAG: DNA internalization-related competence protein ComEC/Rec2 [Candidatus Desulfacyla sp.]
MAISFAGGILAAHEIPLHSHVLIVGLFFLIALLLVALLFSPPRLRGYCLLFIFFFVGALLSRGNPSPSGLIPLASRNGKTVIEGTVFDPVKVVDEGMGRFTLRAEGHYFSEKAILLDENISVTVYRNLPELYPGDRIRFPASIRLFRNFNNPGNYDYERAMKLKGLTCGANVSDGTKIVQMGPGRLPFFRGLVEGLQRPVREFFQERLNARSNALFRALILGERQGITPALRHPFNQTGLGHVLAVSGLHIGLVAGISFFLFKWILYRSYRLSLTLDVRKLAALLTWLPVVLYTLLAGFQVSSQRAMIMVLAFLASILVGREREVWSTLSLAGLIVLLLDPNALFSISFQLSFMAVIGILWLAPAIVNLFHRSESMPPESKPARNRLTEYFLGLAAVSVAATFFLLPVTCYYFHRIPLVSIMANLTAVPILGIWVIPLGLLSAAAVPFSEGTAGLFLQIASWGLDILMTITEFWADLPWSSVWMVTPNLFEIVLFYLLIFFVFFSRRLRWAKTGLAVVVVLILMDVSYWVYTVRFNRDLQVTFLDVGKGNAALVSFPGGKKMLIDGGGFASGSFDVGEMVVAPYLWHSKILRIDYLVLSHPQADHMNGLRFIARWFHPKEFWHNGDPVETPSYKELMAIVDARKIRKMLPADVRGEIQINGVRVQVLHPDSDSRVVRVNEDSKQLNNNSLVLKLTYGDTSFLFPGDLEKAGEEALIARAGPMIQSDILLSPHHGSKTSSSKKFLELVNPRLCVISSGERTVRNFPHASVLKRLRSIGCDVFRIALSGAVTLTVRQDRLDIRTVVDGRQPPGDCFTGGG